MYTRTCYRPARPRMGGGGDLAVSAAAAAAAERSNLSKHADQLSRGLRLSVSPLSLCRPLFFPLCYDQVGIGRPEREKRRRHFPHPCSRSCFPLLPPISVSPHIHAARSATSVLGESPNRQKVVTEKSKK